MENFIRKVIIIFGVVVALGVIILNLLFITKIQPNEYLTVNLCDSIDLIASILTMVEIILICKIADIKVAKLSKNKKIIFLVIVLLVYFIAQIVWINVRKGTPTFDQHWVYLIAEDLYESNEISSINRGYLVYLERFPQQITLTWALLTAFKIFNTTNVVFFQYLNAFLNLLTFIGLLLIVKQLGKKYEVKMTNTIIVFLGFLTLPLLSTFIYGDIVSITMCVYTTYFMMKYVEKRKIPYAILASICAMIACINRMNSLIFVIAVAIYLILDMLQREKKNFIIKIGVLAFFIVMSIVPASIIRTSYREKLGLDENKKYPFVGYFCMAMEGNNARGNGWYSNKIMDIGYNSPTDAAPKYEAMINERLTYFAENPLECIKFYSLKNASMWAENTYSAVLFNHSYYSGRHASHYDVKSDEEYMTKIDNIMIAGTSPLYILQKAIIFLMFGTICLVLIKCRKNISNEVLLLVTIFLGGFFFHILWEAKSRYIIIYIIMLMPIVSINLKGYYDGKTKDVKELEKSE